LDIARGFESLHLSPIMKVTVNWSQYYWGHPPDTFTVYYPIINCDMVCFFVNILVVGVGAYHIPGGIVQQVEQEV
jgi:hypothetical protein